MKAQLIAIEILKSMQAQNIMLADVSNPTKEVDMNQVIELIAQVIKNNVPIK